MMRTDVAILGGGLAGLTLALQLRRELPDVQVTVLERRGFPAPETTFKIGESMVEVSSWYLREVLGLGEHLCASHLPKLGLRFFMSEGTNNDLGRRPEYGVLEVPDGDSGQRFSHATGQAESGGAFPGLHLTTYNIDRGRLENYLWRCCRAEGVEIFETCTVKTVDFGDPHRITTSSTQPLEARWVVDATGRAGFVAGRLNLRETHAHAANAAWFRLDARIDPDEWTADSAFHGRMRSGLRWMSTNHLMGHGYWIWIIPLPAGATSVGIMADPQYHTFDELNTFEKALRWLHPREPQLAGIAASSKVMDFHAMRARSYRSAKSFSVDRWGLCGESAFFIDALYSPGGDFIAVGNSLITQMIAADVTGDRQRLAILSRFGEQLLGGMFQHYAGLYRDAYGLMGNPGAMLRKVAWDTAVYFGYNVFLFCNGRLCDFEFHRTVREENMRFEGMQQQMMYQLRRLRDANGSYAGRSVDQGRIELVQALYRSSRDPLRDPAAVKRRLAENLDVLDRLRETIDEVVA